MQPNLTLPPLLFVDDERNARRVFENMMTTVCPEYKVRIVESAEEALKLIASEELFMVITDCRIGDGMSGYDLLKNIRARWPDLPVLMMTAYATPRLAVQAIQGGAIDYLDKPFEPALLRNAIARCASDYRKNQEIAMLRARVGEAIRLDQVIGDSPSMQALRRLIETVAPTNATVLIIGEGGTGKELIAGAIHVLSQRRDQRYVRVNCGAFRDVALESELFGQEKGAFPGAVRQKTGRVGEADGGTLFLDEIGDMSRSAQGRLLKLLENGSFTRDGGNREIRVDVRLIAATNRDIMHSIGNNAFREDLYHRLNVVQITTPPLRERGDDVILLAEHYLQDFSAAMNKRIETISPETRQELLAYRWPGNVRELRSVIERAVILENTKSLQPSSLRLGV